jgi:hypothetical protein
VRAYIGLLYMKAFYNWARCSAITTKGRRCQMMAESGHTLCKYHVGGEVTAAVHERNRQATRRYWSQFRFAKALEAASAAAETVSDNC